MLQEPPAKGRFYRPRVGASQLGQRPAYYSELWLGRTAR
jgi:hypothetical protein